MWFPGSHTFRRTDLSIIFILNINSRLLEDESIGYENRDDSTMSTCEIVDTEIIIDEVVGIKPVIGKEKESKIKKSVITKVKEAENLESNEFLVLRNYYE